MMILNFSPAILTQRLKELGVPKNLTAFYFAIPFLFPVFSAAIYMKFHKYIRDNNWIMIGKFFMIIGVSLMGPGYVFELLFESYKIYVMTLGIIILGFSTSFNIIPLFPLLMREIKHIYCLETTDVTDLVSGVYTAAFGVGTIIGPLLGAYLDSLIGFRLTTDVLSFAVVLLLICMVVKF